MRRLLATLAAFGTLLTSAFGAADSIDRVSRTVPIASGAPILVDATIADLTMTAADRADVQIDVERRAPTHADLARYPISIDQTVDGLRVRVTQADELRDPRLHAAITIAAPAAAVFGPVHVFEGHVRLANVRTAADVTISRGAIEAARVAGRIRLTSDLGAIDVRDAELAPDSAMRLRVFNGPLHVAFAAKPANARILAVTLNGGITSDIPLTMKDRFGPKFGETTIGSGEPVLSMDVVKGDISLTVGQVGRIEQVGRN